MLHNNAWTFGIISHETLHDVIWIIINPCFVQYADQFITEWNMFMVLLLVGNVSANDGNLWLTIWESTIAALPIEMPVIIIVVYPFRRLHLERLHELGDGFWRIHPNEQMQMISHPIDGINMVFVFFARTVDVTKKMIPPFVSRKWCVSRFGYKCLPYIRCFNAKIVLLHDKCKHQIVFLQRGMLKYRVWGCIEKKADRLGMNCNRKYW